MRQDAITLTIGVLVILAIIVVSDTNLIGKTIYRQPDIVIYEGQEIYCNQYECDSACNRPCSEYRNNHKLPICSHKVYYDKETDESWYMYYKCE